MGFWNEYRASVFQAPPLPTPGGGGGATPAPGTSASPGAVATPKVADRSTKEAFIIGLESNQLQHYWLAGLISDAEVVALKGPAVLASLQQMTRTKADLDAAASAATNPPPVLTNEFANYGASGRPGALGEGNFNWTPQPGQEGQPNPEGGFAPSAAAGASKAVAPGSAPGGSSASSRATGGGGGGAAAAAPPPAPPVANSAADFAARDGRTVAGQPNTILLGGQQYRNATTQVQAPDGLWYNVGADGQPQGAGFKSETAARLAETYASAGPALTSRLGNSPTAKAASQGGFSRTIDPAQANFNLIGLDQSIAAGATRGTQAGDILGTSVRKGYPSLDITYGGISEGGGLTPVGNPADPFNGFTGQLPGNIAIGESSILGNAGHDTQYWLSQMSGLPPSEIAKLRIDTPEKALQFEQAVSTARQQGLLPNFASLYATNEPSGYAGAAGGSDLKWGAANGGASNTPYDQALAGFLNYADLGTPDLTYFPSENGSTQVGNTAYGHQYDEALGYKDGGSFMLGERSSLIGDLTGNKYATMGEAGPERVTIDPLEGKPRHGGLQPLRGGQPQPFAAGGTIYGGPNKGFGAQEPIYGDDGAVTDYGARLGYNSQPFVQGTGGPSVIQEGTATRTISTPPASKSGQPVAASFEAMSPTQAEPFTNQGGRYGNQTISGPLSPSPIGTQVYGNTTLPVYDQLSPKDYSSLGPEMGAVTGYDYVPYNLGGTPVLVRVPQYGNIPKPMGREEQKAYYINKYSQAYQKTGDEAAWRSLYELDPATATLLLQQNQNGHGGRTGGGWGSGYGGRGQDRDIENEAYRRRQYDIQARNYSRAGLPSPTLLDIPRETWSGEGEPPWGSGEAPYQRYGREVQNGFALPFDYNVESPWHNRGNVGMGGGDWGMGYGGRGGGRNWERGGQRGGGDGDMRTPEPGGGRPEGGWGRPTRQPQPWQDDQWFNQLPWWARQARRFGPPVGSGMVST